MLVALPFSPEEFHRDRSGRDRHDASRRPLASGNAPLLAQDQIPDLTLPEALFVRTDSSSASIPDFSEHYIPPLNTFPPPRPSSHCILDAFTTSPSSGRRFAISPADQTLGNALMHTLPASMITPPQGHEVRSRLQVQHDEYHAFRNTRTPTRNHAYTNTDEQRLYMTDLPDADSTYYQDSDPVDRETHRPEDDTNPDPPPPYDSPNARRAYRIWREEEWMEQYRQRIIEEEWPRYPPRYRATRNYQGWDSAWKDIGSSLVGCFKSVGTGVGKMAREMRRKQRVRRAEGKMKWLERHEFVSVRDGNGEGRCFGVPGRG